MTFTKLRTVLVTALAVAAVGCQTQPPITSKLMQDTAKETLPKIYDYTPDKALALADIHALTLFRNQDIFTKSFELDIAKGERLLTNLDYLPTLTASWNETRRNKLPLSTSARIGDPIDGVDTIPSYSRPLDVQNANLALEWDLINIAKNYLVSQQKGNLELIARMNREKAAQNVLRDSLPAYYYAAMSQRDGAELRDLANQLKSALDGKCASLAADATVNTVLATNCQSGLATHSQVIGLLGQLDKAALNLAALISVHPDTPIQLVQPNYQDPGELGMTADDMIHYAVGQRPELQVELLKKRNHKLDKSLAHWDLLPGITIGYTYNHTDNPFTVHDSWEESSLDITWNFLTKVVGSPARARQAMRKYALAESRYRALLVTTVTQIELAHRDYSEARAQWINATKRLLIHNRLAAKHKAEMAAGTMSEIQYIRHRIDHVLTRLQASADYVALMDSMARLYLSVGIPVTPSLDAAKDYEQLASMIQARLESIAIVKRGVY